MLEHMNKKKQTDMICEKNIKEIKKIYQNDQMDCADHVDYVDYVDHADRKDHANQTDKLKEYIENNKFDILKSIIVNKENLELLKTGLYQYKFVPDGDKFSLSLVHWYSLYQLSNTVAGNITYMAGYTETNRVYGSFYNLINDNNYEEIRIHIGNIIRDNFLGEENLDYRRLIEDAFEGLSNAHGYQRKTQMGIIINNIYREIIKINGDLEF